MDVVNLVDATVEPELDVMLSVNLVEIGRQLTCVLAQSVIAVGIGPGIRAAGGTGRGVRIDKDRRHSLEPVGL